MRLSKSIRRLGLGTALLVTALHLRHGEAFAQTDMSGMPGMTPTATPSPTPAAESTASPNPSPTRTVSEGDMDAMPGMKTGEQKKEMSGMPGMAGAAKQGMTGMPGDASAPRMSAPGLFVLRPPQKWRPPLGDDRSGELLSREELKQHMEPLPPPVEASMVHYFPLFDLLEYRYNSAGPDMLVWDFVGWFGGDYNRLWVKTAGRQTLSEGSRGEGDLQLLYGRLISPFWDFQIGARARQNFGAGFRNNTRTYAVIGFQGISPGTFDLEPSLYISDRGEVSAELTASVDVYLTQRFILQPRFQGEVTIQGDPRFSTGKGGTEIDLGVRLRYAVSREVQPYIGVSWLRSLGANERLARDAGETSDRIGLVTGLQLWW